MRFLLGTVPLLAGLALILWQCFHYLQVGAWQPVSMLDVLVALKVKWATSPTSWIGLAKLLEATPGSLGLCLYAGAFTILFAIEPASLKPTAPASKPFRVRDGSSRDFLSLAALAVPPITLLSVPMMFEAGSSEQAAWGKALLLGLAAGATVLLVGRVPTAKAPWRVYRAVRVVVLGCWWALAGKFLAQLFVDGEPNEVSAGYVMAGIVGLSGTYYHALRVLGRTPSNPTGSLGGKDSGDAA